MADGGGDMIGRMYAEDFRDSPCPMCDSEDVRWRGRRPQDFLFTWLRWLAEAFGQVLAQILRAPAPRGRHDGWGTGTGADVEFRTLDERIKAEILEANTGHKTPKRFWRCRACKRSGYEFDERRMPGS